LLVKNAYPIIPYVTEQNLEFGTWYLDYTHREYGNNSMLAVASYNAGPGKVREWVSNFGFSDPDEFAERIPYDETKGYVKHVLGNYWNYLRLYSPKIQQQIAQINQNSQTSLK
jgi:soluble lytic murein transglycosylase